MVLSIQLVLCFVIIAQLAFCEQDSNGKESIKIQRTAVRAWSNQLTEVDYNATNWDITMRHQPSNFFEYYSKRLSDIFVQYKAIVNFALVGACDGTHDRTISEYYLKNDHWRGVFVEPFEINYNDLVNFMKKSEVDHRTHVIHAAATSKCNSSVIKMKRPTFEETNKSLPHWMRRQIGAVVPVNKLDRPATGGWTFEYVRCVHGPMILQDWAMAVTTKQPPQDAGRKTLRKIRPHILKVDVEGHDYDVLMGFLSDDVPKSDLPLLISFEAKSIMKHIDALRTHLHARGYVVSHMANDGFALLRADAIQTGKIPKHNLDLPSSNSREGGGGSGTGGGKRKGGGKKGNKRKGQGRGEEEGGDEQGED